MAAPKFPLKMGDGFPARTLEELRAHADLYNLEEHFRDHSLQRWLSNRDYAETEAVEALDMEAENALDQLCAILGVTVTEEMHQKYIERKEEEHAKAEEAPVKIEKQTAEAADKPEPEQELYVHKTSIAPEVADKIANLLNGENDLYTYVETDHYVLFSSYSARGLSKIDKIFGADFLAALGGSPWYRINKETGDYVKFAIQSEDNENMLRNGFNMPQWNYAVWGDRIIYEWNNRLIRLDIEHQKISVLAANISTAGIEFARKAPNGTVAFCNDDGLFLSHLTGITEITVRGNSIHASALSLREDALYFYCEKTAGLLDDGSNPGGCYCRYDRETGKISVAVSKRKIEELGGPLPCALHGNNLFCICRGNDRKGGGFSSFSAPLAWFDSEHNPSKNLWGTVDIATSEVTLHKKSEFQGAMDIVYVQDYTDGICLSKSEHIPQIHFVDYTDGEKVIWLPKEVASGGKPFLLGQYIYYSVGEEQKRTRWKVSLDNPDNPIRL